jgi:alpha-galactosidase
MFFEEMTRADEANQIDFLDRYRAARLPIDCWWIDAGWYPCWVEGQGKNFWGKTGTWEADPKRFPRGIRTISDHAHTMGIKSLVWFEPERVAPGTWLHDQRPQWLLLRRDQKVFRPGQTPVTEDDLWQGSRLFDLGHDEARAWLIKHFDNLIEREGLDVYRQDFNCNPLPYWHDNDAPERAGLTENRYVAGYLKFWDALLARFPHLLIDSCASGGRRNDLETLRRGVALHPTDYRYEDLPVKQAIRHSLFQWLPYFGGPVLPLAKVDAYAFRSTMGLSTAIGFDLRRDDLDLDLLRKLMTEWQEVAGCFYGDYYPLTPYSRDEQSWMAWQFHRPEADDGVIQVFRRAESPFAAASFPLRGLDPDTVYILHDFDAGADRKYLGRDLLAGWRIVIAERRSARLIRYTPSHVQGRRTSEP